MGMARDGLCIKIKSLSHTYVKKEAFALKSKPC